MGRHDGQRRPIFVEAACYAFGFQCLLLLPFAVFQCAAAYALDETTSPWMREFFSVDSVARYLAYSTAALSISFGIFVAWPTLALCRMLWAAEGSGVETPVHTLSRKVVTMVVALFASTLMLMAGLVMSYPAAEAEFKQHYKPRALLGTAGIGILRVEPSAKITFAIWNNTDDTLQFLPSKAEIYDAKGIAHTAVLIGSDRAFEPVYTLPVRERGWVTFKVGKTTGSVRADPQNLNPRLCLVSIRRNGTQRDICTWVR